jgi:hypothetical protein
MKMTHTGRVFCARLGQLRKFVPAALLLVYFVFLIREGAFIAGGADSSGYLNAARLIREGQLVQPVRTLRELNLPADFTNTFVALGFIDRPVPGTMAPTYPLGLPLLMALGSLAGQWGAFVIVPLCAAGSLALTYAVARELGAEKRWAFAASVSLAVSATFIYQALQPMSDVPALCFVLLSIWAALRSVRGSILWAAAAGAMYGYSVLIRPSNVFVVLPLVIALRMRWRSLLAAGAAAVPFGLIQLALGWWLYGDPLRTGYGDSSGLVELSFIPERLRFYGYWLTVLLTPLVFPAGLLVAGVRGIDRWTRALLTAWFGVFFAFYCAYYFADAWWYTRFVLPAFPAVIIGSVLLFSRLPGRWERAALITFLAAVIGAGWWWWEKFDPQLVDRGEQIYADTAVLVRQRVPPRSLVVASQFSGSLLFYNRMETVRYEWVDPDKFQLLRAHAYNAGYQGIYALVRDYEVERMKEKTGADWVPIEKHRDAYLFRMKR